METIECPVCNTDEHLLGEPNGELIALRCEQCGARWDRDPRPSCASCGRTDVEGVPRAEWDKSRGTQLTIAYITVVYLCPACDAELLRRQHQTNVPLPPRDNPAGSLD